MTACKALLVAALVAAAARAAEVDPPPLALPLAPAKPSSPRWLHKAANGTLELRSSSRGAAVSLDGVELGVVPLKPVAVAPGKHELKLTKDGYQTATRAVQIRPGRKTVLSIELKSSRVAPPPLALPVAPPAVAAGAAKAPPAVASGAAKALPSSPPAVAAGAAKKQPGAASGTAPLIAEPSPSEALTALIASPPAAGAPAARVEPPRAAGAPAARAEPPPPPLVIAAPARPTVKTVPAAALAASPQPSVSSEPLTKKWWFWGGAGVAAAAVLAVGITYALPALYVEKRDPGAACGTGPCVIVNK